MNDKTGGNRGRRRAGALVVAAAVAVLATACGGGSDPPSASAPTYAQVLALAQCMRSHGVPNFPDPDTVGGYAVTSNGSIEGAGGSSIDIGSSQAQAAYGDCQHLPGAPSIAQLEQMVQRELQAEAQARPDVLKWEQCVRSHGVSALAPGPGGQSPAPGNKGALSPNSPQFRAALAACHNLLPPGAHISIHRSVSAP
jgi:hypothetical protein